MSVELRFEVARDVHSRRFHDELVVLDLVHGEYFALDEVGSRVWEGLRDRQSVAHIVAALATVYDTDVARLEADVLAFVQELVRRHLVVPVGASSG